MSNNNKLDHYSYSTIKIAKTCLKKFFYVKIKEYSEPQSEYGLEGKRLHKYIADYFRAENWETPNYYTDNDIRHITNAESYTTAYNLINYEVEKTIEVEVDGYKIVGILDYIGLDQQGFFSVIDWKTGWGTEADAFQTKIYAWLLMKSGFYVSNGYSAYLFSTQWNKPLSEEFYTLDYLKNEFEPELITFLKELESTKKYNPTVGNHCANCCFMVSHCPAWRDITTILVNKDIAEKYKLMSMLVDEIKKSAKAIIAGSGNGIDLGNGKELNIRNSTSVKVENVGRLIQDNLENEILLSKLLPHCILRDNKEVKELIESDDLKKYVVEVTSTPRFGEYKIKE